MTRSFSQHSILKAVIFAVLATAAIPVSAEDQSLSWGYNSYGIPGMIDMPTAYGREDGEIGLTVSHFKNQTRQTLTFQMSKRLSGSFRYAQLYNIPGSSWRCPVRISYDRSFSLQYRFKDEGRYLPAMAIGINDLVGTGVYAW